MAAFRQPASQTVVLSIAFLFLLWANLVTPLWGDDYCVALPVGLTGAFALAWRDYFAFTGRYFVSVITYLAISPDWIETILFDIVNAGIFVCLIRNVIGLAHDLGVPAAAAERPVLAAAVDTGFVALLLWWLPRDIGEVALWKTGSVDYLWAVTGELWVLRWMLAREPANGIWRVLFACVIATFLETMSALVSVLLVGFCLWCWRRRQRAPVGLMAGHVIGTIGLLVAPGNFVRATLLPPSSLSDRLAGVSANIGSLFDAWWLPAAAIVALSLVLGGGRYRMVAGAVGARPVSLWRNVGTVLRAGHGWVFLVLALLYMATLLGAPRAAYAARLSFPASIFLVCYIATVFFQRQVTDRDNRIGVPMLLVLLACHLAVVVPDLRYLAHVHRIWAEDRQFRMGPDTDVTLPIVRIEGRTTFTRKDMFFEGLTLDPDYFVNRCYAAAMHVRSVRAQ